jgi:protein PhnA
MSIQESLKARSNNVCELSGDACDNLMVMSVSGRDDSADSRVYICEVFKQQIDNPDTIDANQWHCLNEAIWSPTAAVQVIAYRMLHTLADKGETWAQDLLDTAYLEDDIKVWAESGISQAAGSDDDDPKPRDSNGIELNEGDSVTLIKDLEVKGGGFTAKRGTLVKAIHLTNNPKHIEGKVNGTTIVLVTAYLKKA